MRICCNRAPMMRSPGSRRRATTVRRTRSSAPSFASAYALNGETERAAEELAEARRLSSDDRFSSLARLRAFTYRGVVPKIRALFEATFLAGLRLAGMPEE